MKGMFLMTASISLFAVLLSASSFAAFGEEAYPTIAEIDAEIASLSNALPVDVSRETAVVEASFRGEQIPEFGSTNALSGTRMVFETYHSSTNYFYQRMLWEKVRRMKSGFNYAQSCFRRQVFNCFCGLILHDFSEYPEPVRRSLWEEFCRRGGATDPEKTEAYRSLYEDYNIVYP